MRILVVTDIHANLAALETVLADAPAHDTVWSLGDIVGYAAQPSECIALLNTHEHLHIPGNHDWGALGKISLDDFNPEARKAALWTREQLSEENRAYIDDIPTTIVQGEVTLAHGSPRYPIWEYVARADVAQQNMAHFETVICLVGHSHIPAIYWQPEAGTFCISLQPKEGHPFAYGEGRCIVNPGSVGQPRDGDPRAAYLVIDTEARTVEHRRVSYDISATQHAMRSAGLAQRNVKRLEYGI